MNDVEILERILSDLNYTEDYRRILIDNALVRLEDSGLDEMTPQFLFITFIHELGRATATKIADYFKQMKENGSYQSELEQFINQSPTFSKFKMDKTSE